MKNLTRLTLICLILASSGCASKSDIPKEAFDDIVVFEKPKEAKSEFDILKNYLDLYGAYKKNLDLLMYLKSCKEYQ